MKPYRVLVTGASGFLGSNVAACALRDYEVIAHSSNRLISAEGVRAKVRDFTTPGAAAELVRISAADVVVNCAALADVDACEHDRVLARRLNAELPGELALACNQTGAKFVHISTDAVFGADDVPFAPDSTPHPVNYYGVTKLEGERRVLQASTGALVIRTNIVGWSPSGTRSLLEFFYARLLRGQPAPAFTDVFFRPMAASDVWSLLEPLIVDDANGVWHATGADLISKHDFALRVAKAFDLDAKSVRPSSVADAGLSATRAGRLNLLPSKFPAGFAPLLDLSVDGSLTRLERLASSGYREAIASFKAGRGVPFS